MERKPSTRFLPTWAERARPFRVRSQPLPRVLQEILLLDSLLFFFLVQRESNESNRLANEPNESICIDFRQRVGRNNLSESIKVKKLRTEVWWY